jgi:putative glutamine amidotransferase
MQLINIYFGGTLIQDISDNLLHDQSKKGGEYIHSVSLESENILHDIFQSNTLRVNSIHHQAIDDL